MASSQKLGSPSLPGQEIVGFYGFDEALTERSAQTGPFVVSNAATPRTTTATLVCMRPASGDAIRAASH
jgi:hypothetical protein